MKKIKYFVDNLPVDKKGHVTFGNIINFPVIITTTILGGLILPSINVFNWFFLHNFILGGLIGVIICVFFHIGVEKWQRRSGKGVHDMNDALAGYSSALALGILLIVINFLIPQ